MTTEKPCESVQHQLLSVADGEVLTETAKLHVENCADCQGFQACLNLTETEVTTMIEPSEKLDHSVLSYAREKGGSRRRSTLHFPAFIRFAVAASFIALLSIVAWMAARQPEAPEGGGRLVAGADLSENVTKSQEEVWVGSDLVDALSETAAYIEDATDDDLLEESLFASEDTAAVVDFIEERLATLQAEVYFASVSLDM